MPHAASTTTHSPTTPRDHTRLDVRDDVDTATGRADENWLEFPLEGPTLKDHLANLHRYLRRVVLGDDD